MPKAVVLVDKTISISERFRIELKVFQVPPQSKYPDGIKARFILIDMIRNVPKMIVDNHAPFGFHIHMNLPDDHERRIKLVSYDYHEALSQFWDLAMKIIDKENDEITK